MKVIILSILLLVGAYAKSKNYISDEIQQNTIKTLKMKNIRNNQVFTQTIFQLDKSNNEVISNNIDSNTEFFSYSDGTIFYSNSKLLVKFEQAIDIKSLEENYNIKFIRTMSTGDHVFQILNNDIISIINQLIEDHPGEINRIMPNVIFNNKPL